MRDLFDTLEALRAPRTFFFSDAGTGLRAVLVIDDLTLGPGAGGVRTRAYPSLEAAVRDAAGLARSMTVKCALAGLPAGGAKAVVIDHPGLDRARAFEVLGQRVEELGGLFRTAGDLGTRPEDLAAMARHTEYVHAEERDLSDAVARGLLRCVEACARVRGVEVRGLRVAVQGAGAIGSAVCRVLSGAGAIVLVADVDEARARTVARETGARQSDAQTILTEDVDVIAPCAIGGVLDEAVVDRLRAWAVCGAANQIVASPAAAERLHARGIQNVPDVIASAGAVIEGIGRTVMGLADRTPLIDRLGATAEKVLRRARSERRTETDVALAMAGEALG